MSIFVDQKSKMTSFTRKSFKLNPEGKLINFFYQQLQTLLNHKLYMNNH